MKELGFLPFIVSASLSDRNGDLKLELRKIVDFVRDSPFLLSLKDWLKLRFLGSGSSSTDLIKSGF